MLSPAWYLFNLLIQLLAWAFRRQKEAEIKCLHSHCATASWCCQTALLDEAKVASVHVSRGQVRLKQAKAPWLCEAAGRESRTLNWRVAFAAFYLVAFGRWMTELRFPTASECVSITLVSKIRVHFAKKTNKKKSVPSPRVHWSLINNS